MLENLNNGLVLGAGAATQFQRDDIDFYYFTCKRAKIIHYFLFKQVHYESHQMYCTVLYNAFFIA
jgi:hypothetical protein